MFDINKTLTLVKGGLFEPRETWKAYLQEEKNWQETAMSLTLPLVLVSAIITSILAWIFSSYHLIPMPHSVGDTLIRIIMSLVGLGAVGFIFSYFASMFGGKHDFNKGFAALSLTAIPGLLGSMLGTLPFVGMLLSLGLGILGLVYLYKIIPTYLEVPQAKRVIHFAVSLLVSFVLMAGLGMVFGLSGASGDSYTSNASTSAPTGMFGEFGRQAELMENAEKDTFNPKKDARISEKQMQALLNTLKKTQTYKKTKEASLKKLDEQMNEKKEELSFSDLMKMASGASSAMSTANAEMEVVKSAGANWAEHTWVKEQLRIAVIQQDINDAVKHNYALYKKHAEALSLYGYTP